MRKMASVRLAEAPSHGEPIQLYDPLSAGALAYERLVDELLARLRASTSEGEGAGAGAPVAAAGPGRYRRSWASGTEPTEPAAAPSPRTGESPLPL